MRRYSLFGFLILTFAFSSHANQTQADQQTNQTTKTEVVQFFMLANLEFTLLHEFGHMLIDEFNLPIFGMEEDAADRIAIIAMSNIRQSQPGTDAIPWLFAVAGDWYTEWEQKAQPQQQIYWDNHGLEIQRFYNIVCLIYGGNADLLDDLIDSEILPFERAMNCEYEYEQALQAVQWLRNNYGYSEEKAIKENPIKVTYQEPWNDKNRTIANILHRSQVAEKLAKRISSRFHFKRPIYVQFENCGSSPDAYWHSSTGTVTVCYELLEHFQNMAEYRQQTSSRACNIPSLRKYMGDHLRCPARSDTTNTELNIH